MKYDKVEIAELERQYRIGYYVRDNSATDRLNMIFKVLMEILKELRETQERVHWQNQKKE